MVSSALKPQLIVLVSQLILFMPGLMILMPQLMILVFQLTFRIVLMPQMIVIISQLVVIMSQPVILRPQMAVLMFQRVFPKPQTVVIISQMVVLVSQMVVLMPQMVLLVSQLVVFMSKSTMLQLNFLVLAVLKSPPELSDLIILVVFHLIMVTQLVLWLTRTFLRFQLDLLVPQPTILKSQLVSPMRTTLTVLVATSLIWVTKLTMLQLNFLVLAVLKSLPELSDLIILVVFHLITVTQLVLRPTRTFLRFQLDLLVSQPTILKSQLVSPMRTTLTVLVATSLIWVTKLTMLQLNFLVLAVLKSSLIVPMPELSDLITLVVFHLITVTQLVLRTLSRFQLDLLVSQPTILKSQLVSPMRTTLTVPVTTTPIWVILRAMPMRAATENFVQPEIRSLMAKQKIRNLASTLPPGQM
jgi:hypothetical protein